MTYYDLRWFQLFVSSIGQTFCCPELQVPEEFLREEQVASVYQNYKVRGAWGCGKICRLWVTWVVGNWRKKNMKRPGDEVTPVTQRKWKLPTTSHCPRCVESLGVTGTAGTVQGAPFSRGAGQRPGNFQGRKMWGPVKSGIWWYIVWFWVIFKYQNVLKFDKWQQVHSTMFQLEAL